MNNFINIQINAVTVILITMKKSFFKKLKTLLLLLKYSENFM